MKVSFLMSVYSEPLDWVKNAIHSVLDQTYENIELIVVLDKPERFDLISMIESIAILDSRIIFLKNSKNIGLAKSLNVAFEQSVGVFIARLDADDLCLERRISKQIEFLVSHDLDFIASNGEFFGCSKGLLLNKKDILNFDSSIQYKNLMPHPSWFMKRDVFHSLNGYRDIGPAQDYEFISRALKMGWKLGVDNEVLIKYRVSPNAISSSRRFQQLYNYLRVRKSIRDSCDFFAVEESYIDVLFKITSIFYYYINFCSKDSPRWFLASFYRKVNPMSVCVRIVQSNIYNKIFNGLSK